MKYLKNYTKFKEPVNESNFKVNEGKDDYVGRHSGTNITLKKGYKHHTEEELYKLYDKIGELVKDDLKVKNVTVVFEQVNEARSKKVTKQMWNKMSDEKRFDALLSVVKDPDDAEKYVEFDWNDLPSGFERDMILFEKH